MTTLHTPTAQTLRWTPAEQAAVMQAARARALQARREAGDAFWVAMGAALVTVGSAITRRVVAFTSGRAPLRSLEG